MIFKKEKNNVKWEEGLKKIEDGEKFVGIYRDFHKGYQACQCKD